MFDELLSPTGIIGLIGMLAAGWAVTKHATVRSLRDDNDDLRKRITDRDATIAERDNELGEKDAVIAGLKDDVATGARDLEALGKVVTGEVHLSAIETLIHDLIARFNALAERIDNALRKKP